jgi:pSer/pThr/pTyr-binding forkhead associated (FHA) protein
VSAAVNDPQRISQGPRRLEFLVAGRNRVLALASTALTVGRRSDIGQPPDVDLSRFNAEEQGVSRRHVVIRVEADQVTVADLDSRNGTRLNGAVLTANQDVRLRDGDELELGHFRVIVRFVFD